MNLKCVHSILLFVRDYLHASGQFPTFSHGDEGRAESHGQDRAEEETSGVETDDDVWSGRMCREDVVEQVGDQCFECERIAQDGEDVEKGHSLWRMVVESGMSNSWKIRGISFTFLGKLGWMPSKDLR